MIWGKHPWISDGTVFSFGYQVCWDAISTSSFFVKIRFCSWKAGSLRNTKDSRPFCPERVFCSAAWASWSGISWGGALTGSKVTRAFFSPEPLWGPECGCVAWFVFSLWHPPGLSSCLWQWFPILGKMFEIFCYFLPIEGSSSLVICCVLESISL